MRRTLTSALLLGLSSLAAAVFKDEVGDIDFHHSLVGVPQIETTFFHRPRKDDKASLLYTLSDVGVLGAVNPSTGAVVWRQQVADDITNGGGYLRAPEGRIGNIWQTEFAGEIRDLEIMELTESSRKDVLVLFEEDGVTVLRRLHGALGSVVWEFREVSKDKPLQVSTNIANVYIISLHGSPSSYSLKVTSLEPANGGRVDHAVIGTKGDVHGPHDVKFVGGNSAAPILAWTNSDLSKLNVQVIGAKSKQELALPANAVSVDIHAPHLLASQPHFLVHTRTEKGNKAEIYHTDLKSSQVTKAYELPLLSGIGAFSTSSDGANVYFTRITDDEILIVSSESHSVLARWPLKSTVGIVSIHAVAEVIKKAGGKEFAVRSAAVTKSDDWVLIRNGEVDWTRPEGLSGSVAVTWAEIPEDENAAKVLAEEAHTNPLNAYIHRVTRHINDLKHLPDYLASLPTLILNSITGGTVGTSKPKGLYRDSFGFNKIIILVTRRGRVYALDTGNHGEVAWSKTVFPQASGTSFVVKGVVSNDEGIITLRGSKGEYAIIKAGDGEVVELQTADDSIVVPSVATIGGEIGKWLLALGPDGAPIDNTLEGKNFDSTVVIRTEDDTLKGVKFTKEGDEIVKIEVWQLQLLPGQKIADVATLPTHDPVASIGRVLGDRGVNYKYLNPNIIVVAVVEEASPVLSVRVIDTVTGQILASQLYSGVDASKSISCTVSENWFSCSFFGQYTLNDGTDRVIKGYQLVVSDMYESPSSNDRGPLGETDTFSPLDPVDTPTGAPLPYVISQAWVVSEPLTKLMVTQTRQGITNRQILAYLPNSHAIMGITRFVVDPRRPVGRDPTAAEMEAEGLMKYAPAIEIDARNFLTHERDVLGVKGIVATPAIVESTTLVVAYGVDVFGSRLAPSGTFDILGKEFNKLALLGTVVALGGGVGFLAPMVRRKQINRKWEAFL
ncbi:ER membrane complex subunit 1-like protein [Cladobotryum mycophilum]|uniref:ER membrane protein complex subunit 1 n=1 Tax=Cladobotryum mycophilum TaxID=491253 RepID=A0ABR0S8Y8_9HYPO